MFLKSCLSSFCKTTLVPQKDTPTGGCPGNERDVRVDCGRSADSSEVHVPESNGRDVGRGTVEFNLRGWVRDTSVTATSFQGLPTVKSSICLQFARMEEGEGGGKAWDILSQEWCRQSGKGPNDLEAFIAVSIQVHVAAVFLWSGTFISHCFRQKAGVQTQSPSTYHF